MSLLPIEIVCSFQRNGVIVSSFFFIQLHLYIYMARMATTPISKLILLCSILHFAPLMSFLVFFPLFLVGIFPYSPVGPPYSLEAFLFPRWTRWSKKFYLYTKMSDLCNKLGVYIILIILVLWTYWALFTKLMMQILWKKNVTLNVKYMFFS